MKFAYIEKQFYTDARYLIQKADEIINSYMKKGFDMTLRQIYYQFIALDTFPNNRRYSWTGKKWVKDSNGTKNAQPNYDWLERTISNARLAGLIDWNAIVDRTRFVRRVSTWNNPEEIVQSAIDSYKRDLFETQKARIEVWIEKDALIGVIEPTCAKLRIPCFSCRGYVSQSAMWRAGQRFIDIIHDEKQIPIILHFGDHDPSGIDMSRDIKERLELFINGHLTIKSGKPLEIIVERLALNQNQIKKFKPPPSPAKITDTRAKKYIKKFGNKAWELDALDPETLCKLISDEVKIYLDEKEWKKAERKEKREVKKLKKMMEHL